jgi:hypothetical protein
MRLSSRVSIGLACLSFLSLLPAATRATVVWNESSNGDLSNNQAVPTALMLSAGTNSIIGTVGAPDTADWVALTIPAGLQLSQDVLAAYTSSDAQGFSGFQAGSSFVGNAETTPSAYLGYAHYGTGATNGGAPTNLIGHDLLALMATPSVAAGAQGFTDPLAAGTYTFLIQQLGAATSYQFDFDLTAAPEPTCLGLLVIGAPLLRRRR